MDGSPPDRSRWRPELNVLVVLASPEYLRFFDDAIAEMARRGWHVSLAVNGQDERKRVRIESLAASIEGVTAVGVLPARRGPWAVLARVVRGTMDFVRYLDPRYSAAVLLRERMRRKALPRWLRWLDRYEALPDATRSRVLGWLRRVEESIPTFGALDRLIGEVRPDVVIVSPLVDVASDQVDVVRSARAAGIPVAAAIASWDNLTNKGLLRAEVDRVIVWNEFQRREAGELHGVPDTRVIVTGAQAFDRWFTRRPSRTRAEFCRAVGLADDRPFILFTGSSIFISRGPDEIAFVRRWIDAVRSAPALSRTPILVRPHPYNGAFWTGVTLDDRPDVAVWPRGAYDPTDDNNRADYFDSLYYCAAVVGINTSAMVEAAILSKPVLTLRAPEFEGTQGGTLHFNYLLREHGGCVQIGATIPEHVEQLETAITQPQTGEAAARRFVTSFLRPHGIDAPCVPLFADAVAQAGALQVLASRPSVFRVAAAFALAIVVYVLEAVSATMTALALREWWKATTRRLQRLRKQLHPVRRLRDARDVVNKMSRRASRGARASVRSVRAKWSRRGIQERTERIRKTAFGAVRRSRHRLRKGARSAAAAARARAGGVVGRLTGRPMASRPAPRPLTILFSVRNFWYVKLFESAIRELSSRGHRVHVIADVGDGDVRARVWEDAARRLEAECPHVTAGYVPLRTPSEWDVLATAFRFTSDYLRFFGREYSAAPKLLERAAFRVPPTLKQWLDAWPWRTRIGRSVARRLLSVAEASLPDAPDMLAYLRSLDPDVVLISPLVTLGSEQFDLLRASQRMGLPTVLAVGSWDHLSSKALIRNSPDAVLVWNETQQDEAVRLHRIPRSKVVVTGAQCFDVWFDRRPSVDAAEFRRRVGLDPSKPHITYVCSALFEGSPPEAAFVERWLQALRSSASPELRSCGILVRPHPKRVDQWRTVDLSGSPNVALWPPTGDAPFDPVTKDDYFHSLYHADAVVGLNTSALIEGAVIGRSVHTVLLPEFRDNQEGTLHFQYLLEVGGGLLCASRTLAEHVDRLAMALRERWTSPAAFVETFVRPHGLDRAATPIFADAVEAVAWAPAPHPAREPVVAPVVRSLVRPLADRVEGSAKVQRRLRKAEKLRQREQRLAQKHQQREEAHGHAATARAGKGSTPAAAREDELQASGKYR